MKTIRLGLILIALIFFVSCGAGGGGGGLISTIPTWITASWTGGATGDPTDRTDTEATEWEGQICPASSVELKNHSGGFAGLNIINNCTIAVTYALCVAKGSLPQPENGLNQCATDPFDTPFGDLKFITLLPGPLGDYVNATEALSVNIFYCSDEQTLSGPPLRCVGAN